MKHSSCTLALIFMVFALPANAAEKPVEPSKEKQTENLDARISNLQNSKDCIKNAASREAVQACRGGIKIRQHEKSAAPTD